MTSFADRDERILRLRWKNVVSVGESGLCCMCGTCEGVCPNEAVTLRWHPPSGCLRPVVEDAACSSCGLCLECCPGLGFDYSAWRSAAGGSAQVSPHIGAWLGVWRGHAANDSLRMTGSSGGVVTALMRHALQTGMASAARVSQMSGSLPPLAEPFFARSELDLAQAQGSHYCPSPANRSLRVLWAGEASGSIAVLGLPCQIAGLRLAQARLEALQSCVVLTVSLFCSRTPTAWATLDLLSAFGIDPSRVVHLKYRSGGTPSCMQVDLSDGSSRFIPHMDRSYWGYAFLHHYQPGRCWLCPDLTGELADISCGDNWQLRGVAAQGGVSTIVVRTRAGVALLDDACRASQISVVPMSLEDLLHDQAIADPGDREYRRVLWAGSGRPCPEYGMHHKAEVRLRLRDRLSLIGVLVNERRWVPRLVRLILHAGYVASGPARDLQRAMRAQSARLLRVGHRMRSGFLPRTLNGAHSRAVRARVSRPTGRSVVITGGYGWDDVGDEAMPMAVIGNLRHRIPDVRIVMLSPHPKVTAELHGEPAIVDLYRYLFASSSRLGVLMERVATRAVPAERYRSGRAAFRCAAFLASCTLARLGVDPPMRAEARTVLAAIRSADVVFNVGGGNINSLTLTELYQKSLIHVAARILGVPSILSGQTIGPFDRPLHETMVRFALNGVEMITLRDVDVSRRRLREVGVTRPVIMDTADDAISLPPSATPVAERYLSVLLAQRAASDAPRCVVALNANGYSVAMGSDSDLSVKLLAEIADRLVEQADAAILLIGTDYCVESDDRPLLRRIRQAMAKPSAALVVEDELAPRELRALIGAADLAVGSRYHFSVFAAAEGVPFVAFANTVYQCTKLEGLTDLYGLPMCYVPARLSEMTADDLWARVVDVMTSSDTIRNTLCERTPYLVARSLSTIERAEAILSARSRQE